jgi:hypothetical protein
MVTFAQAQPGIFAGESGGDYNALYGYQNRPGGRFAGTRLTDMSVGDVMQFTDPRGDYAAYVRGQVGRTATPVGAYQVVGTTLRDAVNALDIDPSTPFNQATQDRIGEWIFSTQGTGAWEGYRGPQAGGQNMDQGMMGQGFVEQDQQDPFANLSRSQRMMLGFAALRDAAASLEGQQSSFFNDAFGGIQTRNLQQQQIDVRRVEQERLRRQGLLENLQGYQQARQRAELLGQDTSQFDAAINMINSELFGGASLPSAQPAAATTTPAPATGAGGAAAGGAAPTAPQAAATPQQTSLEDLLRRANLETVEFGNVLPSTQAAIDAARASQEQEATLQAQTEQMAAGAGQQIDTVAELRQQVEDSPHSVGLFGTILSVIPGSEAITTRSFIKELQARAGFDELAEMRRNNPNGAALGQVTERELDFLQSTIANLDPTMNKEDFLAQLGRFEEEYARVLRLAYRTSPNPEMLTQILREYIPGFNGVPPEPGQPAADTMQGGQTPATGGAATHRFNPETGEFEVIQ